MKSNNKTQRIFLWSGPRNISTTLMYSFAQRKDTVVYDEPLYGAYLSSTNAKEYHPDAELIMKSMKCDSGKVINMMIGNHSKPISFFKNMTHHLIDLDKSFLREGVNVILTRDPLEMLPSFDKVIPNPSISDVGYVDHAELIQYFQLKDIPFVVLDSKKVLLNPEGVLQKLCGALNIPFDKEMLHWEKGARIEDGVWAKHWYSNIHNSTGFKNYKPKTEEFPEHLKPLLTECIPYYNEVSKRALE